MQEGSRVIGLIAVHSYTFYAYTDADLVLLHGVAHQAAIAINNAHLHSALQQELREREELIKELESKNAELERFTYTVSHDLKSPLITIGGFLGFLEKDALAGNIVRLQADIQRIKEAADKMRHLLDDLLELSRIGRLMNRLADQNLLDETVVIYSSDHGLTLGEQGVVGKHGARAQWHIYHVPFFIRHPEGKLAGQWDDCFASNHDIAKTAMSFMGVRPPGMMTGEDLSVIFDGKRPPPRPHFTSCYDDYVLAGDDEWFFLTDSARFRPQLYDQKADPKQEHNVADQHPDVVERYWRILSEEAGGTLPQFSRHGAKPVLGG